MSFIPALQLVAQLTRRVDIVDGDTYVSFNAVHPPRPPRSGPFRFSYPERCYTQAQWFTDQYPFMAFCVKAPEWTGLFSCLAGTRNSFPVHNVRGKYMLDPSLQRKWWQLEQSIIGSCEIILSIIQGSVHTLDMEVYSLPQSWGFMRMHDSEDDARIRILNSRNSFIPLMALFAYAAAINMSHNPNGVDSTPAYIRKLTEGARIDEQWLSELVMHHFSKPVVPRVGVYIDWESFVPTNLLQYIIRYRVPVWIRLSGAIPHRFRNMIPPLIVTREEFEAARTRFSRARNPEPSTIAPPSTTRSTTEANPNVPRNPWVPGDTIRGHIGRYFEQRMRIIEAETPDQLANRLLRELNALQFNCPGRKGAYVYEWQESATGYTRVYIPRDQVPDVWASYTNSQKFYNSIHDEWDLCTELDPDATVDEDYDDDPTFQPSDSNVLQKSSDIANLSRAFVEEKYPRTAPVKHEIHIARIDEVLFMVYGFHPDGRPYEIPSDLIPLDRIPRILVETAFNPEGHDVNQICHFVSSFVKGPEYVPGPLHDLHADNGLRLTFRNPPTFNWYKNELNLFVLTQPAQTSKRIYVPFASLVVQTLRVPGCDNLTDIATLFCAKGSPFYYGDTLVANPFQAPPMCVSGLGFRRRGFKPTWVDYQAYVARRSQLLSNPAIARAALMQGGIVWRLTVDTLQEMHGSVDFEAYFTEEFEPAHLTLHDLGVIVGLYRVWSGDVGADKALSWWPQRHTWNAGGFSVGQWTSACESWYSNRINGIRDSSFDAKGASEWEKSLNLFKQTRQLRRNHENACESFLKSSLAS